MRRRSSTGSRGRGHASILPRRHGRDARGGKVIRVTTTPPATATLRRLERASGALATKSVARMDETLPWFRELPADQRSWVMLVAQAGIASFVEWLRSARRRARG